MFKLMHTKNSLIKQLIRSKHKATHWSVLRKKIHPTDKALEHFDDFYKDVYGSLWLNIRKGLLGKQKYVAVLNNYADTEPTMTALENAGALNMRTLYTLEKDNINEALEKRKRLAYLENIIKQESDSVEDVQPNLPVEKAEKPTASLEASLSNAVIDSSRLVSSNDSSSASSLSHFLPATKLKGMEDFIPESQHYKYFDETAQSSKLEKEYNLHFPEHLNIYCFEEDNFSKFESPKRDLTNVYNYYVMDGGSVLPVLALDLKPGHRFLDMCAAPGGKSYVALQTLYPECVSSTFTIWTNGGLNRIVLK
uniref:NOL1/NOP2/Sun domain family member 4 n=1 Tax=Photinus pyralis TaxID=7054 RepID=A0A1Y1KZT4_PHOPY